jgi:hypothetical protein
MYSSKTMQECDQFLERPHVVFKIFDGRGVVWQVRKAGRVFFEEGGDTGEQNARAFFDRITGGAGILLSGEIFQMAEGI